MTKFPDGIKGLADKIHDMGLKFGIYSSAGRTLSYLTQSDGPAQSLYAGTLTCGGYPASLGYEQIDASTFASWGVDYLVSRLQSIS